MAHKPGDTWTHRPTGAEFIAVAAPRGVCGSCAGQQSKQACHTLPSGCNNPDVIWKPINNQAESFAVILRMQK